MDASILHMSKRNPMFPVMQNQAACLVTVVRFEEHNATVTPRRVWAGDLIASECNSTCLLPMKSCRASILGLSPACQVVILLASNPMFLAVGLAIKTHQDSAKSFIMPTGTFPARRKTCHGQSTRHCGISRYLSGMRQASAVAATEQLPHGAPPPGRYSPLF